MMTAAAEHKQGGKEGAVDTMVQQWWGGEVNKSSILVNIYLTESLLYMAKNRNFQIGSKSGFL